MGSCKEIADDIKKHLKRGLADVKVTVEKCEQTNSTIATVHLKVVGDFNGCSIKHTKAKG